MPRSRGAEAGGCVTRACASGAPFGVAAIPRSRGTARCFLIITRGGIAYTLPTSRRDHSRYAEDEYGSTGEEKNHRAPQAQRINRTRVGRTQARGIAQVRGVPQIERLAQVGGIAQIGSIAQVERPETGVAQEHRETERQKDRERKTQYGRAQVGRVAAQRTGGRGDRDDGLRWLGRHGGHRRIDAGRC